MTILKELEIFANRLCNPLIADHRRTEAARFFAQTVLDLKQRKERKNIKAAVELISQALPKFMIIAQDRSESIPVRVLTMGMAVGDTFSNLSYANWKLKKPKAEAFNPGDDFKRAVTPLSRAVSAQIDFDGLMRQSLQIAENPREEPLFRKGAIILFNKIARVGNASFDQRVNRADYYDRFIDIAEHADDASLRKCAIKIGAFGAEPMAARIP
jgi:hypothetical protein